MIIVIVGSTGVGKTRLSIDLAKELDGEIINGDSTQVYKDMNIGTAKVTKAEMEGVRLHLLSFKPVDEEYSIYDYQKDGRKVIDDIKIRGKIPIVVGGSGLYLGALLYDYKFSDDKDMNISIDISYDEMYSVMKEKYPDISLDRANHRRLVRAYIKYIINDEKFDNTGGKNLFYDDLVVIGLTTDRDKLYSIIDKRVLTMIDNGLVDEVRALVDRYGETKEIKTAIGYKELLPYLSGDISLDKAIDDIQKNSRHYAKRQYTWLKHKLDVNWFEVEFNNFDNTISKVLDFIRSR